MLRAIDTASPLLAVRGKVKGSSSRLTGEGTTVLWRR